MPHFLRQKEYKTESDLLKKYREAYESAKYLYDIDDKLLGYQEVLNFCTNSKKCTKENTIKRNQVLFWTYNQIGDLFVQKNGIDFKPDNYLYAVQYYRHALEFAASNEEQRETLQKLAKVYRDLKDEEEYQKTLEKIILLLDNAVQKEAMLDMAQSTQNVRHEAVWLENALELIDKENIGFLKKCQNKLTICDKLLGIYNRLNEKTEAARIEEMKNDTQKHLN
ncbi:MAG: hypothetical protein IJ830_06100 [Alphaproteobacteria bacterium]|nr:hypothetical protein [Alphaproteobacteria bacterium]